MAALLFRPAGFAAAGLAGAAEAWVPAAASDFAGL